MRALPAAIVFSVGAHAAALAWLTPGESDARILAVIEPAPPPPSPPPAPPVEPAPPEPPPIDIILVDEIPAGLGGTARPRPLRGRSGVEISAHGGAPRAGSGSSAEPAEPAGGEPTARSRLMTMRGPELSRGVSGSFLDDFLARSKPAEPIPDVPGARLDAEIADLRARLRNPGRDHDADRIRLARLQEERRRVELQPDGNGTYKADSPGFTAKVDRDGKARFADKAVQIQGTTVVIDVTDMAMRAAGIDPYASEKLRFLDRTRDQRAAIGREHRRELLRQSAQLMRHHIARLWASTPDLAARKQGLFELWDDCAEAGSAELAAGGAEARKVVIDFVKVELTGELAYTAGELARLNARRRSKAAFAPND